MAIAVPVGGWLDWAEEVSDQSCYAGNVGSEGSFGEGAWVYSGR